MTREEKAEKIRDWCDNIRTCPCSECKLFEYPENDCFQGDADIDRNYETLFGKDDSENDPVNRPSHCTAGGIECIDAIAASMTPDEYIGFLKGQVLKYVWRYRLKGKPAEDLKKARFYLDRLIQITEKEAL